MAPTLAVPVAHSLDGSRRAGMIMVAFYATLSLLATFGFIIYTVVLVVLGRSRHRRREWAKRRVAFLGTAFGVMFVNLVVADLVQAIGFFANYMWIAQGSWTSPSFGCGVQAFLIQVGDVASCLSNVLIAIHTFCVLTPRWKPPNWSFTLVLGLLWVFVFALAIFGPTAHKAWSGPESFWAFTGSWCWVSSQYEIERLYLHYLWVFLSAFGSALLYIILFVRLHRFNSQQQHQNHHDPQSDDAATSAVSRVSHSRTTTQIRAKALNRAGRYMLLYPACFILVTLPLASYRLAGIAGHDWGDQAAAAAGSIFCLSGFVDVILYAFTRRVISAPHMARFRRHRIIVGQDGSRISNNSSNVPKPAPTFSLRVEVQQDTMIYEEEGELAAEKGTPFSPRSSTPLVHTPPATRPRLWDRPDDPETVRASDQLNRTTPRITFSPPPSPSSPSAEGFSSHSSDSEREMRLGLTLPAPPERAHGGPGLPGPGTAF